MAISFIGSAEAGASSGADATLDISGLSLAQNDLVIAAFCVADAGDVNPVMAMVTSGHTSVADLFANDIIDCHLGVFYKFMGASPDASAVVDGFGGADAGVSAGCLVFRGVDTTTPMDVTATTATGIDTAIPDPPSIDWTTTGAWTVIVGAAAIAASAVDPFTAPTNYTTNFITRGDADTQDAAIGMGYNAAPSDPENPGVFGLGFSDSPSAAWCATTLALRPAAGAAMTAHMGTIPIG